MAEKLQNQLKEVGSKLENPPATKDDLIKLLTQATESLSELDQSPPKAILESLQPLLNAIVKPELLKHQDNEVSLLVANCACEITRITAPEAPYDDDVLKDIFRLFVSTFNGLKDTKDPSFKRRVDILDIVAKYRSFVVMLDLECDELINEMFKTFFTVISDEHPETVITSMETIMAVLLEESEDIGEDLLFVVLSVLGRDKKDIKPAARRLAMNVIGQSAEYLEPGIKQFLVSSMSGVNNPSNPLIDYHEVIYDIYRCAPQTLSRIVPHLKRELLTDKIDLRLKAVKLVGELFSLKGSTIPQTFQPIFLEFLKKLTDKVVEVRMSALERAKLCLLSDPSRTEAPQLVSALCDRLLDDDETIRKQVVEVISNVASMELSSISLDTIKLVAKRLEDKSVLVKKYTLERLSDIYRTWCLKQIGGANVNHDYDWIPKRVLRSFLDKDFGQDTVERVLSTSLFPVEFSVKDKVTKWVKLFSSFDKVEVKALEKILEEKQRLQLEFQKYLSLRETYKDSDASELQKKTTFCVRFMSQCFLDPIKAESDFQILDQLKDDSIWKILTTLVDPNTKSLQSRSLRDELLKKVDEKHPLNELLSTLSMKCSYIIFDKDYVKDLLRETDQQKCDGNRSLTQSCLNILMILACFSPLLLSGIEEDLVHLLEDYDDEAIKEGVLHVVAKAGEMIREQLGESSSSLDLILERICLEGSRRQAKYAVHALAAITKDHGLKSLSFLYKRLVDLLEKKTDLPSVLQSLGCIAQTTMPIFETQETKIKEIIRKDILSCSQKKKDKAKESWDDRSELCSLKIFGIKTLVKSYLPVKDAHLRVGIDELIKDLKNILILGEISKDVESSSVDKAHLKLASAKAIIRLSKHWDKEIPVDLFHLTLRTSEVGFPEVRKVFLNKVHQYIKNRSLDSKYACAFLLDFRLQKPILEEENQNLSDILTMQGDGNSSVVHILPYLVHAFAHHPSCPNIDECKDVKAYEPIYRKLYIYFSKLVDEDGKAGVGLKREVTISIISVLRNIKKSKDGVDTNMSKNSYAICDLCLSITKRLARKQEDLHESVVPVSLPEMLYIPHTKKDENKEEEKKEDGNAEDEKKEIEDKEDEKMKDENKEIENKEDEKMEDENKEIENKEDEKIEDENKEIENKEVENIEDEKIEDVNKEDENKEIENKEVEKMEDENKEIENKEDVKMEDEKKEIENKEVKKIEDEKMEDVNKEDENKAIENKELEKIEDEYKEIENKEDENKEDEIMEDVNKEDEKMEDENKDEKIEDENKEDEKMEDEKIEVENKEDVKMEDEKIVVEKKEIENKEDEKLEDEKTEIENKEVEKTEDEKLENEKTEIENKEVEKMEDEKKDVESKEDEKLEDEKTESENKEDENKEIENKEVEKTEDEKKESENKEVEKTEDEKKEDEKLEDEKTEIENNEVEKMEDESKEVGQIEDENKENENKEDEKTEVEKKEIENEEVEKMEDENKEIENKEEEKKEIENMEVEKMEDENKEIEKKEDEEIEDESKEVENKEDEKKEVKEDEKMEDEKKENENKADEKKETENKEEAEIEVIEGRTWLADESARAYFESLILEPNGGVSRINEDDIMKESETDGNEVPLGKILKNLKAKGSKARKEEKNTVETENNVDILGMLKEINLDNMGVSPKLDSSNGYGEIKNKATLKRKDMPNDLTNVSVPKRPRSSSSSAKTHKRLSFMTGLKGGITFNDKMDDHEQSGSEDKGLITDEVHLEMPKKRMENDSNQKSGPMRKRKRRRVSRLVKCTSGKNEIDNEDLVGRRIKVWWPMDKEFYGGVVKSYNDQKKKHVVLYDDGDIEVLYLAKERWKLIDNEHKFAERKLLSYSPTPQEGTSKKNINKSSGSSKQTKESSEISPSSMVRGKRTPRQNLKQGQKGVSQRSEYLEMGRSKDSNVSMPEAKPTVLPKIDNLNACEVEDDSEKVEKSRSKENQMKDAESSSNDSISSHKNDPDSENADYTPCDDESESGEEHKSDSGENQEQSDESQSTDEQTQESNFIDFDNLEYSDDEPLGVWKSRVGKSVEGK